MKPKGLTFQFRMSLLALAKVLMIYGDEYVENDNEVIGSFSDRQGNWRFNKIGTNVLIF